MYYLSLISPLSDEISFPDKINTIFKFSLLNLKKVFTFVKFLIIYSG